MAAAALSASSFVAPTRVHVARRPVVQSRGARMVVRADGGFIGSSTNLIMVASTGLILAAGRFGLAPSANRLANAGLKLSEKNQGQLSGDPAGFTASDVLYGGSVGHIIGAGIVLGLRGVGAL